MKKHLISLRKAIFTPGLSIFDYVVLVPALAALVERNLALGLLAVIPAGILSGHLARRWGD